VRFFYFRGYSPQSFTSRLLGIFQKFQEIGGKQMYYDLVESGKRIKALRKKNGLTQEKLAEQLGIAVNTVARIEIGNRGISIDLAIELAVRFNTTLDYIFLGR